MYKTIISQIKAILQNITAIKAVYAYPLDGAPKKYPAVIFYPDTVENVYSTNTENKKTYKFKLFIVVDIAGTDNETAFTSILPSAVDKVIAEFDENWSRQIDNHRAWLVIDSGIWGFSEENKSKTAYAELSIKYEVQNDI